MADITPTPDLPNFTVNAQQSLGSIHKLIKLIKHYCVNLARIKQTLQILDATVGSSAEYKEHINKIVALNGILLKLEEKRAALNRLSKRIKSRKEIEKDEQEYAEIEAENKDKLELIKKIWEENQELIEEQQKLMRNLEKDIPTSIENLQAEIAQIEIIVRINDQIMDNIKLQQDFAEDYIAEIAQDLAEIKDIASLEQEPGYLHELQDLYEQLSNKLSGIKDNLAEAFTHAGEISASLAIQKELNEQQLQTAQLAQKLMLEHDSELQHGITAGMSEDLAPREDRAPESLALAAVSIAIEEEYSDANRIKLDIEGINSLKIYLDNLMQMQHDGRETKDVDALQPQQKAWWITKQSTFEDMLKQLKQNQQRMVELRQGMAAYKKEMQTILGSGPENPEKFKVLVGKIRDMVKQHDELETNSRSLCVGLNNLENEIKQSFHLKHDFISEQNEGLDSKNATTGQNLQRRLSQVFSDYSKEMDQSLRQGKPAVTFSDELASSEQLHVIAASRPEEPQQKPLFERQVTLLKRAGLPSHR